MTINCGKIIQLTFVDKNECSTDFVIIADVLLFLSQMELLYEDSLLQPSLPFDCVDTQIHKMQHDAERKLPYTGSLNWMIKNLKAT